MNAYIISKESNSFGDLVIKVQTKDGIKTLTYQEGSWPDALQLHNELCHLSGKIIGE